MASSRKKPIPRFVHFETTIPVIRRCRCGSWLAAGVAEGQKAEVEFVPLDLGQQVWAILNRIPLYCLRRSGLVYMDAMRLQKPPGAVYPQHRCEVIWPKPQGAVQTRPADDRPPY